MTFSLLTPAVVALICVLIGIIFRNSRKTPKTLLSTTSKKAVPCPWGEEGLKDGTDLPAEDEGMKDYSWLRIWGGDLITYGEEQVEKGCFILMFNYLCFGVNL